MPELERGRRESESISPEARPVSARRPKLADFDQVATDLAERGFSVQPSFWSALEARALAAESRKLWEEGGFRPAGVGRGASFRIRPQVRNDRVLWIDPARMTETQRYYLARMERLRLALNQALYLGLFGFEAHFTVYAVGAHYRTHRDRFAGASHRVLSCITYLNEDWKAEDGGVLRLYLGGAQTGAYKDIPPLAGTLVVFFSERLYHEVLPAMRARFSISGWFTRRATAPGASI